MEITYNHFLAVTELMQRDDFPKNCYRPEAKQMWLKDVEMWFEFNKVSNDVQNVQGSVARESK